MSRKKGCVWSKFYWDSYKYSIRNMDSTSLGDVIKSCLNYFSTGEIPDFPSEQQSLFQMIQEGIDESRENHVNWCKNQEEATAAANEKRESDNSQSCPKLGIVGVENEHEHEYELESLENENISEERRKEDARGEEEGNVFEVLFPSPANDDHDAYKKTSEQEFEKMRKARMSMLPNCGFPV